MRSRLRRKPTHLFDWGRGLTVLFPTPQSVLMRYSSLKVAGHSVRRPLEINEHEGMGGVVVIWLVF